MSAKVQTDTCHTASAVSLNGVTKTFIQWRRDPERGFVKNLFSPQKSVICALNDVSFGVNKGEFVAYAGPNGAGKSTTMKLLSGMLLPNEGEISVLSKSPQKNRKELMKDIGVLFGNRTELWWDHPVIQSFEWKKVVWDVPDRVYHENKEKMTELLDLKDLLKTFARELSLGQRMRADLALMLLHSPSLLLLDEPTLGLDVVAKRQMISFLKRINRENGVTIVVTSHDMDDLEEMAERIIMISDGSIAYDGSFDGLRGITGNPSRVIVSTSGGVRPEFSGATLISSKNSVFEYEIDLAVTPVRELMRQISEVEGITDVEIKKAPIEQVIAGLYDDWNNRRD